MKYIIIFIILLAVSCASTKRVDEIDLRLKNVEHFQDSVKNYKSPIWDVF